MFRGPTLAAVTAVAALTLAACGGDDNPAGPSAAPVAPVAPETILSANSTQKLGTTVVDGNVMTLYRFDRDSAEPPTSTCVDACAESWPPMLTDPATKPFLEGIDEAAYGTVTRPDGSTQVTIGGWPVYRHAGDEPGAPDGNGVDGSWFAIKPDGTKAAPPKGAN